MHTKEELEKLSRRDLRYILCEREPTDPKMFMLTKDQLIERILIKQEMQVSGVDIPASPEEKGPVPDVVVVSAVQKPAMWERDDVQFPRLLAEIRMVGLTAKQYVDLAESMDLRVTDIDELLARAEEAWEGHKKCAKGDE